MARLGHWSLLVLLFTNCGASFNRDLAENDETNTGGENEPQPNNPGTVILSVTPSSVANLHSFVACTRTITVTNNGTAQSAALTKTEASDPGGIVSFTAGCDGVQLDESGGASDSCTFNVTQTPGTGTDPSITITVSDGSASDVLNINIVSDPGFCPF